MPGERFQYDGNNFDCLTAVIETTHGKPFLNVVVETFFDPLGMSSSVPYHNVVVDADKWVASLGKKRLDRFEASLSRFAQPYTYYGAGETVHDSYPERTYVGAAAGLLSTVRDLARYDIAIDRHLFVKKETQERAWTPFVSNGGERLPYGLGWFVTDYHGHKLVWHYGHWGTGFSAMYLKVPKAEAALTKWIEERRARGKVAVHLPVEEDQVAIVGSVTLAAHDLRLLRPADARRRRHLPAL